MLTRAIPIRYWPRQRQRLAVWACCGGRGGNGGVGLNRKSVGEWRDRYCEMVEQGCWLLREDLARTRARCASESYRESRRAIGVSQATAAC